MAHIIQKGNKGEKISSYVNSSFVAGVPFKTNFPTDIFTHFLYFFLNVRMIPLV